MATYDEIYGKRVEVLDADPTLTSAYEGQVWYNSSTGALKSVVAFDSIVSGSNLLTSRSGNAGAGSQTAALSFGGDQSPPITGATEEFNGSGWSAGGALNTARKDLGSAGTQTAGLGAGGYNSGAKNESEEYNGSAWTEGDNLNSARYRLVGLGTQTAAMVMGGRGTPEPQPVVATVEDYNGTSWTTGTSLNTARQAGGGAGTNTAGLLCGGGATPTSAGTTNTANSEEWDGTSWSEGNNMPSAKRAFAGQNGIQTAAIMMGGAPNTTAIQTYDGTSWATSPATLVTQRHNGSGTMGQPGTTGMAAGGSADPGPTASTEEFNKSINTITAAAWASGTNMPESNYGAGSFGTQTAFVYFGGMPYPPRTNATREYNGTSWATTGNYTGTVNYLAGTGVETAGLGAGGFTGTATPTASAEYDGSSWTAGNSMNQGRMNTGSTMAGTQTAAAIAGGDQFPSTPRSLTAVEEYDGTNWTAVTALPTATQNMAVTGPQTASVFAGGISDTNPGTPNAFPTNVYEYDGTNWTSGTALPIATYRAGAAGTQTDALIFSGGTSPGGPGGPGESVTTLGYDGTSWSTRPNMGTARQSVGAGGTASPSTAAIGAGGYIIPGTTASTEEFTGTTTAVTAKTLTTS